MLNYLIVSSSLYSAQNLINNILINNPKIRLFSISSSIYKAIDILKQNTCNIDIIILDIKTNEVPKFLHLLKNIKEKNYMDSIIILSESESKLHFNDATYLQIEKNNTEIIVNYINKLVKIKVNKSKEVVFKKVVINYLTQLGYNFSHLGTKYLAEILFMLVEENITKCPTLEKLYSIIAKQYNTTPHNVKCVITLATKNMNKNCQIQNKKPFLPYLDNNYIYTKIVIKFFLLKFIHKK